ncbi:Prophage endopeptidase tail [Listeria fleischmannii subsp. fleischmannii]|uniref:Prophage endopeptidase tail n=1 Tax=Listeria fleischmannii subsp. fleischmannii TaxID=1671902 RepID=A0A2X3HD46_9LIST|nr:hypothetical protein [Listeria fleischmannii]SQC70603.1 Prophage endopeptidase tail [Listeria fleischmannii subsp. fleischmannii]
MDILVRDKNGLREEILMDVDYTNFKYEYELNSARNLQFTVYQTSLNAFSFDLVEVESVILYDNQQYVVKSISLGMVGEGQVKEVTAHHISLLVWISFNDM